jgi:hypothetical protein
MARRFLLIHGGRPCPRWHRHFRRKRDFRRKRERLSPYIGTGTARALRL